MRGLAIFFIIFHNYFHLFNVFARENQFTFLPGNTTIFFNRLISGSPWWLCDIFSYLGWYGICTFIFLSGYGLVQKYELGPDASSFSPSTFIHNNWLKLLNLLLPAVAILLIIWGFSASGENGQTLRHIADTLILPSFLNDPLLPLTSVSPGVYWYFGLTLELYIVYALAVHSRPPRVLAILVSFTIVLQIVVGYFWPLQPYGLEWVRHNFTGWLLVFAFGIAYARRQYISARLTTTLTALAAVIFIPAMYNAISWQLTPICAVILAIIAARVSARIPLWRTLWAWTGRLSAFLFVAHPLVRIVFYEFYAEAMRLMPFWLYAVLFGVVSVLLALAYRGIWRHSAPAVTAFFARRRDQFMF